MKDMKPENKLWLMTYSTSGSWGSRATTELTTIHPLGAFISHRDWDGGGASLLNFWEIPKHLHGQYERKFHVG